jgi:pimeloyl-ACP methyl ester carboxylesterase
MRRGARTLVIVVAILALAYVAVGVAVTVSQRSFIFFPTHDGFDTQLRPWVAGGQVIGYCRAVADPGTVWLMAHGNAGQASHRAYVLEHISGADSLYVLEYPGYGLRKGRPSRDSMDGAAAEAYRILREQYPGTPVGVIGESIGSGPASGLASARVPPDKIVLVAPFDTFASVVAEHMPFLPVRAILRDDWDNVSALRGYAGPVDIYGAVDDTVIPCEHARRLAAALKNARFVMIEGGHNDWSASALVRIERQPGNGGRTR